MASNDQVERRAGAPALIEDALSQSSTPSLAHRRFDTRVRSNRLLEVTCDHANNRVVGDDARQR